MEGFFPNHVLQSSPFDVIDSCIVSERLFFLVNLWQVKIRVHEIFELFELSNKV